MSNDDNFKGDKNMAALSKFYEKKSVPMDKQLSKETIEKLSKNKTPIICKNGTAKIDSDHPDYSFWMED